MDVAVVGAGPAGLAFATTAAERGHNVTIYDQAGEIGGQFNMAKAIPGKEEVRECKQRSDELLMCAYWDIDVRAGEERVDDAADFATVSNIAVAFSSQFHETIRYYKTMLKKVRSVRGAKQQY